MIGAGGSRLALGGERRNGLERKWRLGANALLFAIFVQTMPFDRELSQSDFIYSEERYEAALTATASIGIQNTLAAAFVWGGIYLVAAWVIIRFRQRSFVSALRYQWPLTGLLLLPPISLLWVDFPFQVLMNAIHGFGVVLLAFAASLAYWDRPATMLRHVAMVVSLVLSVHLLSVFLIPEVAVDFEGRWRGLSTNSNSIGLVAAIGLFAVFLAWQLRGIRKFTALFMGLIALLTLYGTGSRTPLVAALVGMLVFWLGFKVGESARRIRMWSIGGVLLAFVMGWTLSDFFLFDVAPLLGKSSDLSGRLMLWGMGWDLLLQKPFLGWGFDGHASVISMIRLPTVHFHNGYIDVGVRGGVVALVLFFLMIWRAAATVPRSVSGVGVVVASYISMMLVYNLSEVSILQPRNISWLILLLLVFIAVPRGDNGRIRVWRS